MFDVIGSILISLIRCCLQNDEGPAPQYFFLEPPLHAWSADFNGLYLDNRSTSLKSLLNTNRKSHLTSQTRPSACSSDDRNCPKSRVLVSFDFGPRQLNGDAAMVVTP